MDPNLLIPAFDRHLADEDLVFEATVIGGAALVLMGVVSRVTDDVDVLQPTIASSVLAASKRFAQLQQQGGVSVRKDWLNNGPTSLTKVLEPGWEQRCRPLYEGDRLTLHTLGRRDLLATKLFAFCDRGEDLQDCVALAPTRQELGSLRAWVHAQDANEAWPTHVDSQFERFLEELEGV